ncbi:hypothetical protein GCM10027445_26280 [Amycolatopsis endophytica]|uniref:SnoaL-like domain-containing protein n=1 Tax=Amycolatopsis endophytica TaxID=860233 RepID=A0A853BC76_9PSEU|nr:nuclear transport factor 2 family protein [Amycolatopsis endophytica]NYI92277.1 hypothetical protein [Amycolatopsis endophytica]
MVITDYYARIDGPEPLTGLNLVEPGVEFLIAVRGDDTTGNGQDALRDYLEGRPPVGRKHNVISACSDGDLEMVYGYVTEGNGKGTGSFSAVALLSPDQKIARYQAFFHTTFHMFALPEGNNA